MLVQSALCMVYERDAMPEGQVVVSTILTGVQIFNVHTQNYGYQVVLSLEWEGQEGEHHLQKELMLQQSRIPQMTHL